MQLAPKQGKLYRTTGPGGYWTLHPHATNRNADKDWNVRCNYVAGYLMLFLGISKDTAFTLGHFVVYEFLNHDGVVCRTYFRSDDEFARFFVEAHESVIA